MIKLTPERTFRKTPGVHFADISIPVYHWIGLAQDHHQEDHF